MWNWFNCYLSGRHDFGVWCEPGAVFLRCVHCGKRSSGWSIGTKAHEHTAAPKVPAPVIASEPSAPRILPFTGVAAR